MRKRSTVLIHIFSQIHSKQRFRLNIYMYIRSLLSKTCSSGIVFGNFNIICYNLIFFLKNKPFMLSVCTTCTALVSLCFFLIPPYLYYKQPLKKSIVQMSINYGKITNTHEIAQLHLYLNITSHLPT